MAAADGERIRAAVPLVWAKELESTGREAAHRRAAYNSREKELHAGRSACPSPPFSPSRCRVRSSTVQFTANDIVRPSEDRSGRQTLGWVQSLAQNVEMPRSRSQRERHRSPFPPRACGPTHETFLPVWLIHGGSSRRQKGTAVRARSIAHCCTAGRRVSCGPTTSQTSVFLTETKSLGPGLDEPGLGRLSVREISLQQRQTRRTFQPRVKLANQPGGISSRHHPHLPASCSAWANCAVAARSTTHHEKKFCPH